MTYPRVESVDIVEPLEKYFGFSTFRPGQAEVINAIKNGRSAAAIFPTGSGKSLCYQLPALLLPHLTIVVSPLLALMQDQLSFLNERGISAASIDSTQTRDESSAVMNGVRSGHIKILMISVERLNNERFRNFISEIPISLLVVDEAHCISEWGHNFRPDYLKLPQYQKQFSIAQTLLLTATATAQVVEDMGNKFGIHRDDITLTGFYRSNLHLMVEGVTAQEKVAHLHRWLQMRPQQSGIVYVTLQQTAEEVAEKLRQRGTPAHAYHAGMTSDQRQNIQARFMSGEIGIIVATIAFGMGIDKSDIRFVAHYDLPKSIENYAQEIGRAGRDGGNADCLVLANADNLNVLENFVYGDTPELSAISHVLKEIALCIEEGSHQWEMLINSLSSASNIRLLSLKTLLVYLEIEGVIKPVYSFFAEYKFKYLLPKDDIVGSFKDERQAFVRAIFDSSDLAKTWSTINFDRLSQQYQSDRGRVITALDYLDEKNMIELQTKQMTQVYEISVPEISWEALAQTLYKRFLNKEKSEVGRINQMVDFFTSTQCLSKQLACYFADENVAENCGHCSVCTGHPARLPPVQELPPLESLDYQNLSLAIVQKLGNNVSSLLISRFFCGLTCPIFTRLRVRSLPGYATLEAYRFAEIKAWVEKHNE